MNADTRSSLIRRVSDLGDEEAWTEFCEVYEPLIYAQARRSGLQHADARELVQDVLVAVTSAIQRFEPDARRGRFRTWLFAIGYRISRKHLTRLGRPDRGSGDTGNIQCLIAAADPMGHEASSSFDVELTRRAFRHVAAQVRVDFSEATWQAFWLTTVDQLSVQEVATRLRVSVGSIYVARSRVMARMKDRVMQLSGGRVHDWVSEDANFGVPHRNSIERRSGVVASGPKAAEQDGILDPPTDRDV